MVIKVEFQQKGSDGMPKYYEVDLAKTKDYDYTKGDTVTIAVISSTYPDDEEIETYLKTSNHRFNKLYVCNIVEIDDMESVIPFVEEIIDLDEV